MKRLLLVNINLLSFMAVSPAKIIYSFLRISFLITVSFITFHAAAQSNPEQQKDAYKKVITERAAKIVATLSVSDSVKYEEVVSIIADQYSALNDEQQKNELAVADIKKQSLEKDREAVALKTQEERKSAALMQLHNDFIAHLNENLSAGQVEKVKDGMTYKVFPITYAAYIDMIPALTTEQKDKIYGWLKEARELAMDAESADKKHAVFGKYKGRINNYLSAAGYDMKKEGEEWQKRIKEKQEKKKEPAG